MCMIFPSIAMLAYQTFKSIYWLRIIYWLGLIKQVFIGLIASIVNTSNHTKCISLRRKQCKIQPTPSFTAVYTIPLSLR